jgi:VanZ family protein
MLIRTGAWLALAIIAVLSALPGDMRPEVIADGRYEHFAAYFIAGLLLGLGYPRPGQMLVSGLLLAIGAGALEAAQLWIPGRTASAEDLAISTLGAWSALVLIGLLDWTRDRRAAVAAQVDQR